MIIEGVEMNNALKLTCARIIKIKDDILLFIVDE